MSSPVPFPIPGREMSGLMELYSDFLSSVRMPKEREKTYVLKDNNYYIGCTTV